MSLFCKDVKGDIHKLSIKNFKVLPNPALLLLLENLCDESFKKLSNNHQIFIGLVRIIITSNVDQMWATMKIGPVVTSRFTTTQARCLLLWISQDNLSFGLTQDVNYLIYVWAEV